MEQEFFISVTEEPPGRLRLTRDGLWVTASARSPLRGEAMCKLWLRGKKGALLLGTMVPEKGQLTLKRRFSLGELQRAGAWPPTGVESMLLWNFEPTAPFPRTDLFCFAQVTENRLSIRFDREGQPVMPQGGI